MKKIIVIFIILIIIISGSSCNKTENSTEEIEKISDSTSNVKESKDKVQETTFLDYDGEKPLKKNYATEYLIKIGEENYNLNKLIKIEKLHILDQNELGILRNAIYAKYGYKFKTSKYNEYFSEVEWYIPEFNDVSDMLTGIDKQNINNIVEIEKKIIEANKPIKVAEVVRQVNNKNYSYKVEFYLRKDLYPLDDVIFNHFMVYKIDDENDTLIFDLENYYDLFYVDIIGPSWSIDQAVIIEDRDEDGVEEIYIDLLSEFGDSSTLIINNYDNEYNVSFYGIFWGHPEYKDVDGDGIKELINDHGGGGGWTSDWVGLELVNKWEGKRYEFSYNLTRRLHEDNKNFAESLFAKDPTPGNFVYLLNSYADLGIPEKCEDLIKKHQELVNNEFDYSVYYDNYNAPDESFFHYVTRRAYAYEWTWNSMKDWE